MNFNRKMKSPVHDRITPCHSAGSRQAK